MTLCVVFQMNWDLGDFYSYVGKETITLCENIGKDQQHFDRNYDSKMLNALSQPTSSLRKVFDDHLTDAFRSILEVNVLLKDPSKKKEDYSSDDWKAIKNNEETVKILAACVAKQSLKLLPFFPNYTLEPRGLEGFIDHISGALQKMIRFNYTRSDERNDLWNAQLRPPKYNLCSWLKIVGYLQ